MRKDSDKLIDLLIERELQRRRERQMRSGLFICIFNKNLSDRSSTELNGKFVQYQLLINCLLQMESSAIDRREFLSFYKRKYANIPSALQYVHRLENYQSSSCLQWYTRESFVYKDLNEALRTQNIHSLFLFRFLIKDIKQELTRLQSKKTIQLYRRQLMANNEFEFFEKNQGNFISMNSFLSTTIDRSDALRILSETPSDRKTKRILFEIDAQPYENSEKPFADIMDHSEFPNEREYLMMLGSIFKIGKVFEDEQNEGIFIIQMTLINEHQSEHRKVYQHLKDQYQLKSSRYLSLGYVLIDMAQFHFSQFYLQRALEDPTTDLKIFPKCYQALGKVSFENGFFQLSLEYFYRALNLIENFHRNDSLIPYLYNNIGEVFEKQGFYLKAFHAFYAAIREFKRILPSNDECLSWCYNNIGIIYQRWNHFDYALFYLEETLRIQEKILSKDHPCSGNTHNNLGNVYYSLKDFDKALKSYRKANRIFSNSLTTDHPSIARTLRNLGLVYENQNDFRQAEKHYEQCQKIRQKILPPDHPDLLDVNEDLHRTLKKLHRHQKISSKEENKLDS